jgi:rRNA maturation protein Rpf1
MSDEIKNESDDLNEDDEQSEEINGKISMNGGGEEDEEENEPPHSTPNGHESPSATSFSDVIIEKQNEEPQIVSEDNHAPELLQTISDKSNKEATSIILNTVKKQKNYFYFPTIFLFSLSMEILILTKITLSKNLKISRNYFQFFTNYHLHYKPKFSVY